MIFTVTGSSGSGKTSLVKALVERYPNDFREVVSTTTREARPREIEGKDYYFISEEAFDKLVACDLLAEYVTFGGNSYGIAKSEFQGALDSDQDAVVIVDCKGAAKIKELYGDAVRNVYLAVDKGKAMKRLVRRDGWSKAKKRIAIDEQEGLFDTHGYDCILNNDKTIKNLVENFCNYAIAMEYEQDMKGVCG